MQLRSKVLQIDSLGLLNRCLPELRALDPCTEFVAKGKLTNPSHSKTRSLRIATRMHLE